jgi:hypothetical protein
MAEYLVKRRDNLKVKLSLCVTKHHATKMYWGSGGIAPRILDLGTRWRWMVGFTLRPLYTQGKSLWYPLDRRLGGPQSCSGHGSEEKNSHPRRESNPRTPIVQSVAQRQRNFTFITYNKEHSQLRYSVHYTDWSPHFLEVHFLTPKFRAIFLRNRSVTPLNIRSGRGSWY